LGSVGWGVFAVEGGWLAGGVVWCGGCCRTGILAWFLNWGMLVVACLVECSGV
jgi:hypothetical protein